MTTLQTWILMEWALNKSGRENPKEAWRAIYGGSERGSYRAQARWRSQWKELEAIVG